MALNLTDKQNTRRCSNNISSMSSIEKPLLTKHAKVEMVVSSESEGFGLHHHRPFKYRHVIELRVGTISSLSIDRRRSHR